MYSSRKAEGGQTSFISLVLITINTSTPWETCAECKLLGYAPDLCGWVDGTSKLYFNQISR